MAQWRRKGGNEVFSSEEIEARLKDELPQWYLEDGWIRRKYKTSGWKATLMVVNTVGHLAEAAWHHPDLTVSYAAENEDGPTSLSPLFATWPEVDAPSSVTVPATTLAPPPIVLVPPAA